MKQCFQSIFHHLGESSHVHVQSTSTKNFLLHKNDTRIMFSDKKRTLAFTVLRTVENRAPTINSILFCTSTLTPDSNDSYIKRNEFKYVFRK